MDNQSMNIEQAVEILNKHRYRGRDDWYRDDDLVRALIGSGGHGWITLLPPEAIALATCLSGEDYQRGYQAGIRDTAVEGDPALLARLAQIEEAIAPFVKVADSLLYLDSEMFGGVFMRDWRKLAKVANK